MTDSIKSWFRKLSIYSIFYKQRALFVPSGLDKPRVHSKHGWELPSARMVSAHVHRDEGLHDHAITIMSVAWGQAMDHDMTLTAETKREAISSYLVKYQVVRTAPRTSRKVWGQQLCRWHNGIFAKVFIMVQEWR